MKYNYIILMVVILSSLIIQIESNEKLKIGKYICSDTFKVLRDVVMNNHKKFHRVEPKKVEELVALKLRELAGIPKPSWSDFEWNILRPYFPKPARKQILEQIHKGIVGKSSNIEELDLFFKKVGYDETSNH